MQIAYVYSYGRNRALYEYKFMRWHKKVVSSLYLLKFEQELINCYLIKRTLIQTELG